MRIYIAVMLKLIAVLAAAYAAYALIMFIVDIGYLAKLCPCIATI